MTSANLGDLARSAAHAQETWSGSLRAAEAALREAWLLSPHAEHGRALRPLPLPRASMRALEPTTIGQRVAAFAEHFGRLPDDKTTFDEWWVVTPELRDRLRLLQSIVLRDRREDQDRVLIAMREASLMVAEAALTVWEATYPDDDRPRRAVETAKVCLDDDSEQARDTARRAAYAAGRVGCALLYCDRCAAAAAHAAEAAGRTVASYYIGSAAVRHAVTEWAMRTADEGSRAGADLSAAATHLSGALEELGILPKPAAGRAT